jgi:hypothetical protein
MTTQCRAGWPTNAAEKVHKRALLPQRSAWPQRSAHAFDKPDNSYTLARLRPTHDDFARCLITTSAKVGGRLMTMLHDVAESLRAMTLLHLLLAFLACIGYMLAEGQLAPVRVRLYGGLVAAASAIWFVIDSPQWTAGAMLVALAVGIVGLFTALVWTLSALLGLRHTANAAAMQPAIDAAGVPADKRAQIAATRPGALPSH